MWNWVFAGLARNALVAELLRHLIEPPASTSPVGKAERKRMVAGNDSPNHRESEFAHIRRGNVHQHHAVPGGLDREGDHREIAARVPGGEAWECIEVHAFP